MKKVLFLCVVGILIFCSCAGLEVAMENSKIQVLSNLDNVPFFDSKPGDKVFIRIENFSIYPELNEVNGLVAGKYRKRGFVVVDNPDEANWILQAKIVNVTKEDISARQVKGTDTAGAVITGGGIGAVSGGIWGGNSRDVLAGALIGGILSGAASLTVDSWVKLGYLTIITDIQVKEKKNMLVTSKTTGTENIGGVKNKYKTEGATQWMKYRFQALSRAKKANLEWKDCKDAMIAEISRILSSIL